MPPINLCQRLLCYQGTLSLTDKIATQNNLSTKRVCMSGVRSQEPSVPRLQDTNCLRIKLLGDCYYCVCGLPTSRPDHAICCVEMGLGMLQAIHSVRQTLQVSPREREGPLPGTMAPEVRRRRRLLTGRRKLFVNDDSRSRTNCSVCLSHYSEVSKLIR